MSIEREIGQLTNAVQSLVDQMAAQNELNQRILEVLIEVAVPDDPDNQPLRDMEGNPV